MVVNATEKLDSFESVADKTIEVDSVAAPSKSVKKNKPIIRDCKVLYWNKYSRNFAFDFDGKGIQITLPEPLNECGKMVRIRFADGKYTLER